jgi:MOSC domain-containing protein YiiM
VGGRLHQINVSDGGVPKRPVGEVRVTRDGLDGDWQRDRKHHGGPDRAVSLFALEVIRALQAEGHPIAPGTTGENLTIEGLAWAELRPGDRVRVGDDVVLELTGYADPCRTIQGSFADRRFGRIAQRHHPGDSRLYARVIAEGAIRPGDRVERLPGAT